MKNPALLVIDMLNDFLDQWPLAWRKRLLDSTGQLVTISASTSFRLSGCVRNLNRI